MKDDAVIKDNEAVYLLNEQTYLHLRENLAGVGYEVFDKNSPLPVEEGQIPREALGNTQRRIETARAYYLAEHQDADPALRFAAMRYLNKQNIAPSVENYEILYRGNLPEGKRSVPQAELLEQLYQKFNCAQPMDYHGHSLSVNDVILLNQAGKISAHYVDSIGFRELSGFQDKQERSSVLSQLKAKCDMPECNPTKCRKGRNDHEI